MELRYKADTVAAVTKVPRGSLGSMRAGRLIPSLPYDLGDLLSLALARRLIGRMPVKPATAIAWAAKETWAEVIAAEGEAHEHTRYIVVTSNEPGDPVPYTWVVSGSGEALVDQRNRSADPDANRDNPPAGAAH